MRSTGSPLRDDAVTLIPATEEDLLTETAGGEHDAFVELYDRTVGPVYGVILRVLRDPAQSEEVAQEVFIELWRIAARFDAERGCARTWILVIAHRRAVDRVRSEQRDRDVAERLTAWHPTRPFDEVAEHVETSLEHAQVRTGLSALSDVQRQAVELAYYQGYTYREVAERLEVPLGTVKARIRDGIIRLRDAMGSTA